MTSLLKYYFKLYFKSSKLIAPVVIWIIFLYVNNTTRPSYVVANYTTSSGILYWIMMWIGYAYMELEDIVSEQILILKVRKIWKYNMSKVLVLILTDMGMSIIGVIIPITQHIINGCSLYTRNITMGDAVYSFILLFTMGFLGMAISLLMHPRIFKNRKVAMLTLFLIGLLGYLKGPIIEDLPILKFILWIVPPAFDILMKFVKHEYFDVSAIGTSVLLGGGYGLLVLFIHLYILRKNKF